MFLDRVGEMFTVKTKGKLNKAAAIISRGKSIFNYRTVTGRPIEHRAFLSAAIVVTESGKVLKDRFGLVRDGEILVVGDGYEYGDLNTRGRTPRNHSDKTAALVRHIHDTQVKGLQNPAG